MEAGAEHQVTEIIELKDGEAFLAAATGSLTDDKSVRNVAVKLKKVDEHGNVIAVTTTAGAMDAISVATAAADIKEGDLIEEDLGPQAPQAVTATVTEDAVVVAASEGEEAAAVVTLASASSTIDSITSGVAGDGKTIVLANLGEEHKDILNAILADGGATASNGDGDGQVQEEEVADGTAAVKNDAAAVVESVVAATESAISPPQEEEEVKENGSDPPPPVTVDEFVQEENQQEQAKEATEEEEEAAAATTVPADTDADATTEEKTEGEAAKEGNGEEASS